jgi:hypothetical protein
MSWHIPRPYAAENCVLLKFANDRGILYSTWMEGSIIAAETTA